MIQSMTGFGKATGEFNGKKIVVEIKSLNSKQMDISTRIIGVYREKEIEIRNELSQALERGKIDLSLYIDNSGKDSITQINPTLFESYHQQIKALAEQYALEMPTNWFEIILRLPEVMKTETAEMDENEWKSVKGLLSEAITQIKAYRIQEGKSLEQVFRRRIEDIRELLSAIEPFEAERVERIKTKLEENLQNISEKFDYDKNRLEQELIFYIEKLDVNEEKVRLLTHLDYFLEIIDNDASPGKKLGFIAQEMGREINTLGSKANHSEMQKIVVLMKDYLEQIKEQVLNVL
jgi:uncharacterized protein (TIGR00255 family)